MRLAKAREQELQYKKEIDHLDVEKQQKLAEIESQRFKQLVDAIGSGTLTEMARAGPELQVHFNISRSQTKTPSISTRLSEALRHQLWGVWWGLTL